MKIRTAIFGVYVAASAVGFAVLMAFILSEVRPRYVDSMRRTLNDTAELLAAVLAGEPMSSAEVGAAWRERLAAVEQATGGLRVYLTDARGIVTFDSAGGRDVGKDYSGRPEIAKYLSGGYAPSDDTGVVDGELRASAPIGANRAVVGYVGVARALSSVADAVWRARLRLAAGGLAVAAIMVTAGWWIASRLTRSLERLTAHVEAIRDGRTSTVPATRAAEVAALAHAFEEMRTALEGKAYVERYTQALAHELKAPLSAVRGATELLGEDLPAEERARFLAHLRAESDRLQRIVDRMLQLSSLEARRGLEEPTRIDLEAALREAIEALRPAWLARDLEVRAEPGAPGSMRGEAFLIGQALANLLQNAIEFSPKGGRVVARILTAGRRLGVQVDDEGPGIPDYAQERIFERFYSLPRPDTGRKSTGLGLTFVREIALLHGGEARVGNRPGGGARAEVWFPADGE